MALVWRFSDLQSSLSPACRWASSADWARRTPMSSILSVHTSVSNTRTTRALCSRCWSRTFTTSWSTASSARCCSSASGRSCSRWPRRWWSWRAWAWSTPTWSLRTSCWWTLWDSRTESKSLISARRATCPRRCAPPTCSPDTTGEYWVWSGQWSQCL